MKVECGVANRLFKIKNIFARDRKLFDRSMNTSAGTLFNISLLIFLLLVSFQPEKFQGQKFSIEAAEKSSC